MPAQTLRHYQEGAVNAVVEGMKDGFKRMMYVLPTGCGKTTVIAELVNVFCEVFKFRVLILAHRKELIDQIRERICEHCGYDAFQVGIERADSHSSLQNIVVVGSVQTVIQAHRMPEASFDVIIVDECHHAASVSYRKIATRFGVDSGKCIYIGCTATAKRSDRASLYAKNPDGSNVSLLDKKTKRAFYASEENCVYQKMVYQFSMEDAINSGWLVPMRGHRVQTATSLNDVKMGANGDFSEGALQEAVDRAERTILAINAWKRTAIDRKTIVFCAGVQHAYHSAELWAQSGVRAVALHGDTAPEDRDRILQDFKDGRYQVLCNMGLFTEGFDCPEIGAVVMLRPTKSWGLYVQMAGRGARPLHGVLNGIDAPEDRRIAIQKSAKPDCILLDLVDICDQDICSAPAILDLPYNLDLEGHDVAAVKGMLDEIDRERLDYEIDANPPVSYKELEVILEQIDMLKQAPERHTTGWKATQSGYRYVSVPPQYSAVLDCEGNDWRLVVTYKQETLLSAVGASGKKFETYLGYAQRRILEAIDKHRETLSRGTLDRLTPKQIYCLERNGFTQKQIDAMPYNKAKALVAKFVAEYHTSRLAVSE